MNTNSITEIKKLTNPLLLNTAGKMTTPRQVNDIDRSYIHIVNQGVSFCNKYRIFGAKMDSFFTIIISLTKMRSLNFSHS